MSPAPFVSLSARLREDALAADKGLRLPAPRYHAPVLDLAEAGRFLEQAVSRTAPCMICRWGNNELTVAADMLKVRHGIIEAIPPDHLDRLSSGAGFFPADAALVPAFCDIMLESLSLADAVGVWESPVNSLEDAIIRKYAPGAALLPLGSLSPAEITRPWSRGLKGRKVLVVHPFSESIRSQYARRTELFVNPHVLPPFELVTLKAVQSQAGEPCAFADWFQALEWMADRMAGLDFDVALIGAGAYGMPLAARAKRMGKAAVHVGGALQLLFGIMGSRWERKAFRDAQRLWNVENWVRPLPEETPTRYEVVEQGCYW